MIEISTRWTYIIRTCWCISWKIIHYITWRDFLEQDLTLIHRIPSSTYSFYMTKIIGRTTKCHATNSKQKSCNRWLFFFVFQIFSSLVNYKCTSVLFAKNITYLHNVNVMFLFIKKWVMICNNVWMLKCGQYSVEKKISIHTQCITLPNKQTNDQD